MAIVMSMRWAGVTPEQYDEVKRIVGFEENHPAGGVFHVAAFDGDGLRVVDVWESAEQFQRFVESELRPGVAAAGIDGEPEVEILPAHNVFAPAFEPANA
jgi:hypothetical protein